MTENENGAIRIFADNIWGLYTKGRIEDMMSSPYQTWKSYRAKVISVNSNGTMTVQAPYEPEITIPYASSAASLTAGEQCTVLMLGSAINSIVVGDGSMRKFGGNAGTATGGVNLLDNWYFIGGGSQQGGGQFPINQRGNASGDYTGYRQYILDRWQARGGIAAATPLTISLDSDGLGWSSPVAIDLVQFLEAPQAYAGKTVTLSLAYALTSGSGQVSVVCNGNYYNQALSVGNALHITARTVTLSNTVSELRAQFAVNGAAKLYAVKLELGNEQTLGRQEDGVWVLNDPPPIFQQELAKCQRYLQVYDCPDYRIVANGYASETTAFRGVFPTPVTMRAAPTVTKTVSALRLIGNVQDVNIASANITDVKTPNPGSVPFNISGLSGLTRNQTYALVAYNGSIVLSAEI